MSNLSIALERDSNREAIPLMPAKISLHETYDTTVSASTQVTFNAATCLIEVSAITQGIMMKWGTSAASTSDFDHYISAGSTRQFVVPVQTAATGVLYTAANFIEQAASAILVVSEY